MKLSRRYETFVKRSNSICYESLAKLSRKFHETFMQAFTKRSYHSETFMKISLVKACPTFKQFTAGAFLQKVDRFKNSVILVCENFSKHKHFTESLLKIS